MFIKAMIGVLLCSVLTACTTPGTPVMANGGEGRRVMYAKTTDNFDNQYPKHLRYYYEPWGYQHYYGGWYYQDPKWQNTSHALSDYLPKKLVTG